MIVAEVLSTLILLTLVAITTWMAIVGLMGVIGAVRFKRCRMCGHLRPGGSQGQSAVCPYCRHPWLAHHLMPVRIHHFLPAEMEPPR